LRPLLEWKCKKTKGTSSGTSTDQCMGQMTKAVAIKEIDEKLRVHEIDIQRDEVYWTKTSEKLNSRKDLQDKLDEVK